MTRSRLWLSAALILGVTALAACSGGSDQPRPSGTSASNPTSSGLCPLAAKAVPTCGPLWGVATTPATMAAVGSIESSLGRTFDIVYRYHDIDATLPDADERAAVARGSLLHIAIAARHYDSPETVTYAQIAAGDFDADLKKQAQGVASLKAPVYVTFEQEANQKDKAGSERGTPAEFITAWRHIHDTYTEAGATNAVWVWVMTGNADSLKRAGGLWPGNDFVDWISWNVYNQSGCRNRNINTSAYRSFEDGLRGFYTWVTTDGKALGIDSSKPMMISEAGSAAYPNDLSLTAKWYADIPAALTEFPQVKAVTLWANGGGGNQGGTCDYRFQRSPEISEGVAAAGKQLAAVARSSANEPSSTSSTQ